MSGVEFGTPVKMLMAPTRFLKFSLSPVFNLEMH